MAIDLNTSPYYDDFDEAKKFYRILYRPAVSVQARELTQMQTILQNQVSKFGDHMFKDGSMVIPGEVNVNSGVSFAKLENIQDGTDVKSYLKQFVDMIITGGTSGLKARVLDTSECDCVDDKTIATLYFVFEGTGTDNETKRFEAGEVLTAKKADNTLDANERLTTALASEIAVTIRSNADDGGLATSYTNNPTTDVTGNGLAVEVKEGVYYIDGRFVKNDELHYYAGRFQDNPTVNVGFKVTETLVKPEDDNSLNDNARGTPNYAAPGAHRLKVDMTLGKPPTDVTKKFVKLISLKAGQINSVVKQSDYAELEKTLARRTYDESGNYEVTKFMMKSREHRDTGTNDGVYPTEPASPVTGVKYGKDSKFAIAIEPGKAYVRGFEIENVATRYIDFNRAREDENSNENGHVVRLAGQPVGTPTGNYVIVNNAEHFPDFEAFEEVHLCDVRITTDGTTPGSSNQVGSARVRMYQVHSGDHSDGDNTEFKLGLFDIQMDSGKTFERDVKSVGGIGGGSSEFTADIAQTIDTSTTVGLATSTTGDPTVTGKGTNFIDAYNVGDAMYIDGTFIGIVDSITSSTSLELTANGDAAKSDGRPGVGRSEIFEGEYRSLLFPVGYNMIKTLRGVDGSNNDTVESADYVSRRIITENCGSSGWTHTLTATNETFLSDVNAYNYTLIDNTDNVHVDIDASDISFDSDSNRKIVTIDSDLSTLTNGRSYSLLTSIRQTGTDAGEKTKTLNNGTTQTVTGKKDVTAREVTLTYADIYKLESVKMTPGDFATYNDANAVDITDRYTLDNGQRATHYQAGKIVLKPGAQPPTGAIRITYDYYSYSGDGNYFSVNSYSQDLEDIPEFKTTVDGRSYTIALHDAIDFRPVISGSNAFNHEIPAFGTDFTTDFAYYVGRIDKLALDAEGQFNVLEGTPSLEPQPPKDPNNQMVLAEITVPPYTKQARDVKIKQRANRRYTMADIGSIDRRVKALEYYIVLNLLEQDTARLDIKDTDTGLDRFKNGFIVDAFTGHGIGDVKQRDYRVSIDRKNQILRPMHHTEAVNIVETLSTGAARASAANTYSKTSDLITLPYTESTYIENTQATRSIDINPYKLAAFKGEVRILPDADLWKSTVNRPDLQVTDDNNFDAIKFIAEETGVTGTFWDEWKDNWTGTSFEVTSSEYISRNDVRTNETYGTFQEGFNTQVGYRSRTGERVSISNQNNGAQNYGDRIVDISYAEFMRPKPITYIAANLKPETKFYGFFDGVAVDSYIRPADIFTVELPTGYSSMNFYPEDLDGKILMDDPRRASEGKIEPAFQFGDVVTNQDHTATYATAVTNITDAAGAASFTMTVNSSNGIKPGHLVYLYNFSKRAARDAEHLGSMNSMQSTGAKPRTLRTSASETAEVTLTEGQYLPRNSKYSFRRPATPAHTITGSGNTSKQLDGRVFLVSAVDSDTNELTLEDPEGATIAQFDSYSTANYGVGDGGKVQRLTASAVVSYAGVVNVTSPAGAVTEQDIHLTNIVNGFAVGDRLLGKTEIAASTFNVADVKKINGSTSTEDAPTMKVPGDTIESDAEGTAVGVFNLPNNERLKFRVGERKFKLSDNISNTDEGFDSKGSAAFTAQGYTIDRERTIVTSRQAQFATDRLYEETEQGSATRRVGGATTRWVNPRTRYHDPLAQTFTVRTPGGAMVTDVDIYFSATGRRPVTVEIRNTNSVGIPDSKVLPFSQVTIQPFDIGTSSDASIATNFKFKAPVYLQNGETYALIIKTDEPGAQVFVSELGGIDLTNSSPVNQQPLTGTLYLSQNGQEFVNHPLKDLKFTLRQAKFTINETKTVNFKGVPPLPIALRANPIQMAPNTNKVRVYAPNHGFLTGNKVLISGVAEGTYGAGDDDDGFLASGINGTHTVQSEGLEPDSFIIQLPTDAGSLIGSVNNLVKGFYGGSGVTCSRQLGVDAFFLNSQDVVLNDTTLKYFFDIEKSDGTFDGFTGIVPGQTKNLTERKYLKSFENMATESAGPPILKTSSLKVKAELYSNNDNVSPVIDLQQIVGYGIQNRVSSFTDTQFNVIALDSTPMTNSSSISNTTVQSTGTGTITYSTSNNFASGTSTNFAGELFPGDILRRASDQTVIGTVLNVNSATQVQMTRNAEITDSSPVTYIVQSNGNITFSNANTTSGQIVTNMDAVDDTLQNVKIGQHIDIKNVMTGINGSYLVTDVTLTSANNTFGGNPDQDKTTIRLGSAFTKTNQAGSTVAVRLHSVNATASFVGTGTMSVTYGATGVSGSSTQFEDEVNVGDFLETATGNVIGKVSTITDDTTITLAAGAQEGVSSGAYRIQSNSANFSIDLLDRYVDDIAVEGATNLANYITRPLSLTTAAQSIRIIMDVNIPAGCSIKAMYKTASDLERLDAVETYTDSGYVSQAIDSEGTFREVEINIDDLDEFKVAVVKLVMKSTNTVYVPKVQNLRMICHS